MAEVIGKQIRNCLKLDLFDTQVIDEVSVRAGIAYMGEKEYKAVLLAASTLLQDVASFEPPLADVSEDDVHIEVGAYDVTASLIRRDVHTVSAPGYTFSNYPAQEAVPAL